MRSLKSEYPHNFLFCLEEANLRKDDGEGMKAVDAYRELLADAAKPGYFATSKLELADFGLGDALRGQRHYDEAAQVYEHAASTPGVGLELKIRSLLGAGKCRDLDRRTRACRARLSGGHRCRPQHFPRRPGQKVSAQPLQRKLRRRARFRRLLPGLEPPPARLRII